MELVEIKESLEGSKALLENVVYYLDYINSEDSKTSRVARNMLIVNLFNLVDTICNTEIDIYNYLKGE